MHPGISVVICCYNSENRIGPTLRHLFEQEVPDEMSWEIIVVDNGCTDDTVQLVQNIAWESTIPLRIVFEEQPGLSHARKRGLYAAGYEIVCFCDDDNWLGSRYLATAWQMMTVNPEIGVLAGRGIPVSTVPIPEWFASFQESYACGALADQTGEIPREKLAWGAGMIVRNSYLRNLFSCGFYHINEDRKGIGLASGGDSEICIWHLLTGKKLWYHNDLAFEHFISPEKLDLVFAEKLRASGSKSYEDLWPYYPLLYGMHNMGRKKPALFWDLLMRFGRGQEAGDLYAYLSPWFDHKLKPETVSVIKALHKFRSLNQI